MNIPTLLAIEVFGSDSPVTIGLAVGLGAAFLAYGEARVHIQGLRETVKAQEAKIDALETRQSSAEVREGRLLERFEALVTRLDRMEGKLDQILDQQRHPTSRHTT